MKLYVMPVEKACDAKCSWCSTNFRDHYGAFLDPEVLETIPGDFEKIEITGGGEPTLHKQIDRIIALCSQKAKTQMYTHGEHLSKIKNLDLLSTLCVSIAHHDLDKNRQIMDITPDLETISQLGIPVKFSLLLHKSGISQKSEFLGYIEWAKQYAGKVVVRQIFEEHRDPLEDEFVSSEALFNSLNITDYRLTPHESPLFSYGNLEVEIEHRTCACELDNPVIHADGNMYRGWSDERI